MNNFLNFVTTAFYIAPVITTLAFGTLVASAILLAHTLLKAGE